MSWSNDIPRASTDSSESGVRTELRRIELRSRRIIDAETLGRYRSAFRGSGLIFADLREYQPGDEVKHISWKASTRTGKVFVKTFHEDRQLTILLVVDVTNSTNVGAEKTKHQRGLEFAALVATLARQSGDAVGLCTFGGKVEQFMPPSTRRNQIHRVLFEILRPRDLAKATDLAGALEYVRRHQRRPAVIFVVSDFVGGDYEQELRQLSYRHDVIAVLLDDALDRALPSAGLIEFTDAESGARALVDSGDLRVQARLAAAHAERGKKIRELCHGAGADCIAIERSVVEPLAGLMERRARRYR